MSAERKIFVMNRAPQKRPESGNSLEYPEYMKKFRAPSPWDKLDQVKQETIVTSQDLSPNRTRTPYEEIIHNNLVHGVPIGGRKMPEDPNPSDALPSQAPKSVRTETNSSSLQRIKGLQSRLEISEKENKVLRDRDAAWQNKVETLQSENQELLGIVAKLEKRVADLEAEIARREKRQSGGKGNGKSIILSKPEIEEGNGQKEVKTEVEPKPLEMKFGSATWKNKDYDLPVKVRGYAGQFGGKDYVYVEGSDAALPLNEIEYPKEAVEETSIKEVQVAPKVRPEAAAPAKKAEAGEKTDREKLTQEIAARIAPEIVKQIVGAIAEAFGIDIKDLYPKNIIGDLVKKIKEKIPAAEKKVEEGKTAGRQTAETAAEEKERQRKLNEEKLKIEAAKKEGEEKGKEEGEKEGQKKLLEEIKRPRGLKERFRILFRPRNDAEKYLRRRYLKTAGAVALGAAVTVATWAGMQYFGRFLPSIPININ